MHIASQISLLGLLLGVGLALEGLNVLTGGEVYLASIQQLVAQDTSNLPATTPQPASQPEVTPSPTPPTPPQPPAPQPVERPTKDGSFPREEHENDDEGRDFIDPHEIQQILREIKQLKSDIKRISNQLKKIAGTEADLAALTDIRAQLDKSQAVLSNSSLPMSELREAAQDFRDNAFWDQINKYRAKAELPQQVKQIASQLKRLEKIIKTKAVQNLGLNLGRVETSLAEIRQNLQAVQDNFNGGNYEEAMEAMQYFHDGGSPGEIEGTIHRVREMKRMLNQVKDASIRAEVDKVLQEVINAFNEGNYRDARETMDEYADDMQRLISQFLRASRGRINRTESLSKIKGLEDLVKSKLQEVEERRENKENTGSPEASAR